MLKFGTRYYMPNLTRWTQIDPKAGKPQQPPTINPYLYAECNATNKQDPDGRSALDTISSLANSVVDCVVGGSTIGVLAGGYSSLIEPGLGTAGGFVLGFAYGCPAGIIGSELTGGENPVQDFQGVFS
jgi:hypothetical protein